MTSRHDIQRPYADAWREYRRSARLSWLLFVGFVPFQYLVAVVTGADSGGDVIFGITGVTWATVWIITSLQLGRFQCPRCKREYFRKWPRHNGFARRCLHCGLRKWAVDDEESIPGKPSGAYWSRD